MLTFQVIRRSIATLAQRKGTVKDVPGIASAFAHGHHDRCVHAGAASGRCRTGDAINRELRKKAKSRSGENFLKMCYQMPPNPAAWKTLVGVTD